MRRRRFLQISALAGAATLAGRLGSTSPLPPLKGDWQRADWNGILLGTEGTITLYAQETRDWNTLHTRCRVEISRLEGIFSLFDSRSELVRLNHAGLLARPSSELLEVLTLAKHLHAASGGHFNPALQPLWELYQAHFRKNPGDLVGPTEAVIGETLTHCNFDAVELSDEHIRFRQGGMALTLNGLAQGYITDRIAALLEAEGFSHVLVQLGEIRVLGSHPTGRPWRLGLRGTQTVVDLNQAALATSAGEGTPIGSAPRIHHLFDGRSGLPAQYNRSLSVRAPSAVLADGLSTALYVTPPSDRPALESAFAQTEIWAD